MDNEGLFCSLASADMALFVQGASRSICYAAPGIQVNVAQAMVKAVAHLGQVLAVVSQRTNLAARPRFDGWGR